MSKLDTAWESIFDKYQIEQSISKDGFFEISAQKIKEFREPRLMTKFDWSDSRPKIFKANDLSILPNTRGTYVIGKFKAYHSLNYKEIKPILVKKPDWVRSFDDFPITSESVALNLAQMTGMIDTVMETKNNEPFAVSTITGRLKSGSLTYTIDQKNSNTPYMFELNNSQVEIDAGFENLDNLLVVEAKNRIPQDFMIRQLYYPYRGYNNLNTGKKVMPVFFTYADNIFAFHIFEFTDLTNYSSIHKIKQLNFIIDQELDITLDNVKQISNSSPNLEDPITFPQADSFTRVLDMLQYLHEPKDKFELSDNYKFDERQGDYYGNALRYLGLAGKVGAKFELTKLGNQVSNLPNSNTRNIIIIKQVLSNKCFNLVFKNTLKHGGEFDNEYIDNILLNNAKSVHSESTAKRRRSTVKGWINWILNTATTE
ncbi:type II restriction enzyme [Pediococcus pentosaceus]|uniref:type II restriction enzyme n=1 Tax=Pediococcus pentosaceus TaxID=1255 RepID=UPI0023AFB0A3|nr:hypothetical protein [Pediococcus pentosaceus]MDE7512355.1 hypothetical protein [Pediococcus pentosaceus]